MKPNRRSDDSIHPAGTDSTDGIVLHCGPDGTVRRVVFDDLQLSDRVPIGATFTALVDDGVREKAERFLMALQVPPTVFDWEITVPLQGTLVPLHWAGVGTGEGLLVVAARTRKGLANLTREFVRIECGATEAASGSAALFDRASDVGTENEDALYDDLSRLNNELANLQRELAKKNAELERVIVEKDELLGMTVHDLRNPLGVIAGYAEFLADEAVLSPEHREFLAMIKESSGFMLRLIDDLLDINAIESGHIRLKLAPVRLATLLRRNVALNSVLAEKKKIRVVLKIADEIGEIPLDAVKIQQVLNNFLSNAFKYSNPGTQVVVHMYRKDDEAVVTVSDEGQGIPADELANLFKPFQTTSVRGTAGEPSTGLGLAIARKIVVGHGGHVAVESEVGRGSTFSFRLPLTP